LFKVGNILVENGRVESKWESNFDLRIKNNQNEVNIEKCVERIKNGNAQTKTNKVEKNVKQIMKKTTKFYIFKEKFGEIITKLLYVGHFIVWMMGKRLKEQVIKSWDAFCVELVNGFNPRIKERKGLITYYKTYGIIF